MWLKFHGWTEDGGATERVLGEGLILKRVGGRRNRKDLVFAGSIILGITPMITYIEDPCYTRRCVIREYTYVLLRPRNIIGSVIYVLDRFSVSVA